MIRLVLILWNKGNRKLAPKLLAISVGNVPKPKKSINNPPWTVLPLANDQVNAEYTSPHGNQPQITPYKIV